MATYSLAVTGMRADSPFLIENQTLPDDAATPGSMALAMRTGRQLLCRGNDGALAYYVLDAERSTPTVPVLRKVS